MRKNFLTTGAVVALAWISLAPLSLLFIATVASSNDSIHVKGGAILAILFSWIFLSMGTGVLWRKESRQPISSFSPLQKKSEPRNRERSTIPHLEMSQSLRESDFSGLCIQIFEKIWPTLTIEKLGSSPITGQDWIFHLNQKSYLVHCENKKTFFDSREIHSFKETVKKKGVAGGYFFTTGVFSVPAQEVAASGSVELIDGHKTAELFASFLEEKDLPYDTETLERRRYPRIFCEFFPFEDRPSVELGNIYQRTIKTKAHLFNISNGGVCIEFPQSEELPVFFQLILKLPPSESLHILGEVVWQQFQETKQIKRYGISFLSMADEGREKLNLFLEKELFAQVSQKKERRIV